MVPVLHDHQISVQRLTAPLTVEVEVYYATNIRGDQYFQGSYLRQVTATKRTEKVTLPAGTFFVPSGQARSNLVSYLLEPESDDNLITWGYLDDFVRVTPPAGARAGGAADPEDEPPAAGRGGRAGGAASPGQRVPIFRLMKQNQFATEIVEPYDGRTRNRFVR